MVSRIGEREEYEKYYLIAFCVILIISLVFSLSVKKKIIGLADCISRLSTEVVQLEKMNDALANELVIYVVELLEKERRQQDDDWRVEVVEVTAYAPLDPRAEEGVCYEGEPEVTASGEPVVVGDTAAAELPFGTRIWIEGVGYRTITDRGGMVNRNGQGVRQVDIAVDTREEAMKIGRRKAFAIYRQVMPE